VGYNKTLRLYNRELNKYYNREWDTSRGSGMLHQEMEYYKRE
jgi:hypothetical protein